MNKKLIMIVVAGSLSVLAGGANAEPIDGVKILEQEASRARELQNLEYQAKLLEQRARVAQAYQNLKRSGGVVPDGFLGGVNVDSATSMNTAPTANTSGDVASSGAGGTLSNVSSSVPTLKKMTGRSALFETTQGQVFARVGMLLPGGYKLVSLDVASGAKLEKDGMIYLANIGW